MIPSWYARSGSKYMRVANGSGYAGEKSDSESDLGSPTAVLPPTRRSLLLSHLIISVSIFVNLVLALLLARSTVLGQRSAGYSFEKGYRTELAAARDWISVEEKRFDGAGVYNAQGRQELRAGDSLVYVGEPSPELEEAWFKLTNRRYFMLSAEEARNAWPGEDIEQFWDPIHGGYVAGLEVFHIVHCLSQLRETLYPETYGKVHATHLNHCIESMRQYIMCSADLTPIPTRFYESANTTYVESDLVHTCRNFGRLQDFLHERREGPTAVAPLYRPYGYDEIHGGHAH